MRARVGAAHARPNSFQVRTGRCHLHDIWRIAMRERGDLGNRVSAIAIAVIALSSPARAQPDDYVDDTGEDETPTQVDHEGGFVWTTADDAYQLRLGGYLQARWELDQHGTDPDNGFMLHHALP